MRLRWVIPVALTSVTLKLFIGQTQTSVPVPSYTLHIPGVRSTVMSREEKYLAALVVKNGFAEVEVWDFRSGSLLKARALPAPQPGQEYRNGAGYVRYTSDDQFLAAYPGGDLLYLLRASGLEQIRTIKIQSQLNVTDLEVSPSGHRLAVRMSGDISLYDLDSGEEIRHWSVHQYLHFEMWSLLRVNPQLSGPWLAWDEDGTALAMSVADNQPCLRGGGTIYILNLTKSDAPKSFRVGLLPSAIAFGHGDNLYVASNTCGGYFSHWRLDLPILDAAFGRETGKIPAAKVGIRNNIAISANRQFLLAYADLEKTTFEGFEDTLKIEDAQWQVWDLETLKLILTLPPRPLGGGCSYDALSSSGRFVHGGRGWEVCVFSVPPATK
jgi:WD40 repeat protein